MLLIKLNVQNRTTDSTANQIKSKKYKLSQNFSRKDCVARKKNTKMLVNFVTDKLVWISVEMPLHTELQNIKNILYVVFFNKDKF